MANARLIYRNAVVGSTLTASAEAAGYEVEALLSHVRTARWRSDAATGDQSVTSEFTSQSISAVAIGGGVTIHAGGSVKAQTWNGSSWVDKGTFTIPVDHPRDVAVVWFTPVTTTKVRILFVNTGSVAAAVEFGIFYAGAYLEPAQNISKSLTLRERSLSSVVRAEGGQRYTWQRPTILVASVVWTPSGNTDRQNLRAAFRSAALHQPVIFAIDPDQTDLVLYGYLPAEFEQAHLTNSNFLYRMPLTVEEAA